MNYGTSKQSSQAESGLRGTQYQDRAAGQSYQSGVTLTNTANQILADPLRFQGQTGSQLLPGGKYGLGSNADAGVYQFGQDMFNKVSGSYGARGQLSPENVAGVVGSATTNALPSLLPYIQQWQLAQFQAPVNLNQYAMQTAQAPASFWNQALGAQSQATGSSFNFGLSSPGGASSTTPQSNPASAIPVAMA